jgi:hypothetical protein
MSWLTATRPFTAMDVTESAPSSSTPAPILLNWKELTGALVLSQGAEAVRPLLLLHVLPLTVQQDSTIL